MTNLGRNTRDLVEAKKQKHLIETNKEFLGDSIEIPDC